MPDRPAPSALWAEPGADDGDDAPDDAPDDALAPDPLLQPATASPTTATLSRPAMDRRRTMRCTLRHTAATTVWTCCSAASPTSVQRQEVGGIRLLAAAGCRTLV
ncbi:hypothetical protein GCM10027572_16350 [Flexivirga lutea]